MELLRVIDLMKIYKTRRGGNEFCALSGVSFGVEDGEYTAIMGESGSGKTTLLNLLAALDTPTGGNILLSGKSYAEIPDEELSAFRREHLGFVFQDFHLLDTFNVQDNILLPLVLADKPAKEMKERMKPLVQKLGIENLLKKYPYEISGGQKQRTAIARALITRPKLLLADEPTGALDSKSSDELLSLFSAFNDAGQTIIMVTHSVQAAARAKRVLFLKDGKIVCELRKNSDPETFANQIFEVLRIMTKGGRSN